LGSKLNEQEYKKVIDTVRAVYDLDLDYYKPGQMIRRLSGFLTRVGAKNVDDFCELIKTNDEVKDKVLDFMTINVTEFFRDSKHFETLQKQVLPEILEKNSAPRIWSAGSSRGAEAYSVAMMINEINPKSKAVITGSDLDYRVLNTARNGGPYPDAEVKNIPAILRSKYMEKTSDGIFVKPEIRSKVTFKRQNLLTDRFDSNFDLIMCRNVVIYFSDDAKDQLNTKFSKALKKDGVLFIGGTETILSPKSYDLDRMTAAFYRKSNGSQGLKQAA